MPTLAETLQQALRHHQSRRLHDAEQLYRQILAQSPNHPDANHLLGILLCQSNQPASGIPHLQSALASQPNNPDTHNNLGNALRATGHLPEAIAAFQRAIALNPNFAQAYANLGAALRAAGGAGQLEEAVAALNRSIAIDPRNPDALNNLANALRDQGRLLEAIAAFEKAIQLNPDFPEALTNLGDALVDAGRTDDALALHHKAIALSPNFAPAHNHLGVALRQQGDLRAALASFQKAVDLNPNFSVAHNNRGATLRDLGQLDQAIASCQQAIALDPDSAQAHSNLATALYGKLRLDDALAAAHRALQLKADLPEAHMNLAFILLLQGDLPAGWPHFEHRFRCKDFRLPARNFPQPVWDGSPLHKTRTLLLHAEQGLGDTLQFIRYLPSVLAIAPSVVVECQPEIHRLLQQSFPKTPFIPRSQPLPRFDLHAPLLSLPKIFNTSFASIPNSVPYLAPLPEDIAAWKSRLATYPDKKIGLCWAGNPRHADDLNRSVPLALFSPLFALQNIHIFSLQKSPRPSDVLPPNLIDLTPELHDFADTAALLANLDHVVTVDTSIAHLAGALARLTHLLLPHAPDWRWLLHREDSPWYPTLHLHRQSTPLSWPPVIADLASHFANLSSST